MDYTPWVKSILTPQPGAKAITQPIVVLADNFSASLAELLAIAIHSLPNGIFIGENTFGATGPLAEHDMYNDGSFSVPGFMHIQMASAQFKYLDDKLYEGAGFLPDVAIPFDFATLNTGKDPALEKAINK
jgi:C-terminal processing protease CtpA/Prc